MIIQESKIVINNNTEGYVNGYFLTIHDLAKLVRDFQADNFDGFVSNDLSYIENWLEKHERIVKKD